jgi:UDP:flavonoid glycosyltransferase YjiC (YdhE family)
LSEQASTTLTSLAEGADLVVTGLIYHQFAASAAEYYDIPLAALDLYPMRANGQFLPNLPPPLGRCALAAFEWLFWRMGKRTENAHRRGLGLPKATKPVPRRFSQCGSLEIQAYDEVCFPGLAAEWAKWDGRRPFVGALTMELPTEADDDIASWIAAGTPPIFFGFGSIPVKSPADTLAMISAACAQLGERALVCSGWSDFSGLTHLKHVKVVRNMNYAAVFPTCRAIVHHGGSGTTAATLRAGVPTLILWMDLLQAVLSAQVIRLKVGTARRFSATTQESLIADIRSILAPEYATRAREVAAWMTEPATSLMAVADVVENFVRKKGAGN